MALGAERREIMKMVLGQGTTMALTGVVIGLGVAFGLTRLIAALLFQVSATDPPTFSLVPVVLLLVALVAAYLPARRAARVEPMDALRDEPAKPVPGLSAIRVLLRGSYGTGWSARLESRKKGRPAREAPNGRVA